MGREDLVVMLIRKIIGRPGLEGEEAWVGMILGGQGSFVACPPLNGLVHYGLGLEEGHGRGC